MLSPLTTFIWPFVENLKWQFGREPDWISSTIGEILLVILHSDVLKFLQVVHYMLEAKGVFFQTILNKWVMYFLHCNEQYKEESISNFEKSLNSSMIYRFFAHKTLIFISYNLVSIFSTTHATEHSIFEQTTIGKNVIILVTNIW